MRRLEKKEKKKDRYSSNEYVGDTSRKICSHNTTPCGGSWAVVSHYVSTNHSIF